MPGEPDPLYVLARRVLLDALDALAPQRGAVILVTREAMAHLEALFSRTRAPGARMAARAASPLEDADTIAASCAALAGDLLQAVAGERGG